MRHAYRRAKNLARPGVEALRGWREWAARTWRAPATWNGEHHLALRMFPCWRGESDGRFFHDFLGVRTHPRFRSEYAADPEGPVRIGYPRPTQTYFELVTLLEAVLEARGPTFHMIELGAGYGPWLARAAAAARQMDGIGVRLVGVEMEPTRFAWMDEHLRENGVAPAERTLIHAAVSDHEEETIYFADGDTADDYGLALMRAPLLRSQRLGRTDRVRQGEVRVPCVRLRSLMSGAEEVDLVHMDIQGEEAVVVRDSLDGLERKVRRLVIGTHSLFVHVYLRALLKTRGWRGRRDFLPNRVNRTEFGDMQFVDGLLVLENGRLL
jgi:FkbM family methyltransferase